MARTLRSAQKPLNGSIHSALDGQANGAPREYSRDTDSESLDRSRWRLRAEGGRHTWHYLKIEKEVEEWPQTVADKYHLGLPTVCADQFYKEIY